MPENLDYISLQEATKFCDYTQEYLSLRARQGKLKAIKFGRNWVTKEDWLKEYLGKVEEYGNHINNGFKTNHLGRVPQNLPVEADEETIIKIKLNQASLPKFSLPSLRPIFSLGLVFILFVANIAFGREELSGIFGTADSFVTKIGEKSDVVLKDNSSFTYISYALGGQGDELINGGKESITSVANPVFKSGKTIFTFGREGTEIVISSIMSDSVRDVISIGKDVSSFTYIFGGKGDKILAGAINSVSNVQYAAGSKGDEFLADGKESTVNVGHDIMAVVNGLNSGVAQISEGGAKSLKGYFSWLEQNYLAANDFVEVKIADAINQVSKVGKFVSSPWNIIPERVAEVGNKDLEKIQQQINDLEARAGKETVKTVEVSRITQVEPVREITKEILKIDDKALAAVRAQLVDMESAIGNRLYAPGGVITQQIYIKEPVASPKIYQENADIVLQTAGTGNVILSAATGMQISGKQVVIDSTSVQNPLVYIADPLRVGGRLDAGIITGTWQGTAILPSYGGTGLSSFTTGDILIATTTNTLFSMPIGADGQVLTVSSGQPAWAAAAGGAAATNWIISGTTMYATDTISYLGVGTTTPSTTLMVYGTSTFMGGRVGIGTTTPGYTLAVAGNIYGSGNAIFGSTLSVAGSSTFTGTSTLGNINAGTWQGTAIGAQYGGTGLTTYAKGDILFATTTSEFYRLATGTENQVLTITSGIPAWAAASGGAAATNWIISGTTMYATDTINYLGIGTTTPSSLLELSSATSTQLTITTATSTFDPQIVFRTGLAPADRFILGVDQSDYNRFKISTSTLGTLDILTIDPGTGSVAIGTSTISSTSLFLVGTSTPALYVGRNSGFVGIGTTGPGAKLHVLSNITNFNALRLETTVGGGDVNFDFELDDTGISGLASKNLVLSGSSSGSDIAFSPSTGYPGLMVLKATGRVGIGTTTPASLLELSSATSTQLTITTATSTFDPQIVFRTGLAPADRFILGVDQSDSNKFKIATSTLGTLDILTIDPGTGSVAIGTSTISSTSLFLVGTSTPALYVDRSSGYVGIGTTTPAYALDVYGQVSMGIGSEAMRISSNGNVGIGTSTPATTLQVYGTSTFMGGNVGIGTTTPASLLELSSATSTQLTITTATSTFDPQIVFRTGLAPADRFILGIDQSDYNKFKIATSTLGTNDLLVINPGTGFVGIATTSPSTTLMVYGTSTFMGGRVGIGTTTPGYTLSVVGNIYGSGNAIFGSTLSVAASSTFTGTSTFSGNVGIGTTTPSSLLELSSATSTQLTITTATSTFDPQIVFRTGLAPADRFILGIDQSDYNKFKIATSTLGTNDLLVINPGTGFVGIATTSPSTTLMVYGTSTFMGGSVGIGQTNPSYTLDVTGTGRTTGVFTSGSHYLWGALIFKSNNQIITEGGDLQLLPASGKVGIGTTTPSSLLELSSATSTQLTITTATSTFDSQIVFKTGLAPVDRFILGVDQSDYNKFKIATSTLGTNDLLVINPGTGFVGIATTSPATTFQVYGTSTFMGGRVGIGTTTPASLLELSSATSTRLTITTATSTFDPQIVFRTGLAPADRFILGVDQSDSNKFKIATSTIGTTDVLTIDQSGRVGIATSSPARMLEVLDVSNAQMRITQSGSQYSEFQVDVNGDLTISAAGGDIQMLNENLWVCALASCGISISGAGNLVVENNAYFAGNKIMYPSELGQPKRSIILTSAGAITPTLRGASQTKVDGTNHTYYVLGYSDATTSSTFWQWVMPDSFATATAATSVVDVTLYWEATSTSGDVIWQITTAGVKADSAEDIDPALGNTATTVDTAQANADDLGSITISNYITAWEPADYIIFNVSRLGTDTADTLTASARLVKVKIEYSVKQEGD